MMIDGSGPLGGWEDNYIIPGHTRECHPDFRATPIGDNPSGFLICQRRKEYSVPPPPTPPVNRGQLSQSHSLYGDGHPRVSSNGGQPLRLQDRRPPNQAHLQGVDYYRDSIRYRGVGIERVNALPGDFGYLENKYMYSAPPPRYDVTHAVQPYELWSREQLRHGHLNRQQLDEIDSYHGYVNRTATF